jgi:proteasome maturation protein
MDPSHRIVPANGPKSAAIHKDTTNSFGLHDTLQYGTRSIAQEVKSDSAIKQRLESWEETQDNLKLTLQRNIDGLHAPIRLLMERKIVSANPHMPALPQSNIHLDILMGRDETLEPADFFGGMESGPSMDIHADMEKKRHL